MLRLILRSRGVLFAASAALATIPPPAPAAQGLVVNPDGLGEVLLFPYYTTRGGFKTLLSIVNTRNEAKIVKVRFLEGYNSREVLDFNLFLSPFDVWVASVEADQDSGGARILTPDSSCTVGMIFPEGEPFRPFAYTGSNADSGPQTLDRTREGHLEVIEMGVINRSESGGEALAVAIEHPSECMLPFLAYFGSPANVDTGIGIWNPLAGGDPENAVDEPTGGLYGNWELIHVERGDAVGGNPVALAHFFDPEGSDARSSDSLHTIPGTLLPNLNSANQGLPGGIASAVISDLRLNPGAGDPRHFSVLFSAPVDAVSAALMHERMLFEYTVNIDVGASTAAVITFPTKNAYVDVREGTAFGELAPFTSWSFSDGLSQGSACEPLTTLHWDREETLGIGLPNDFSPPLPEDQRFALCWETNVIHFGTSPSALDDSALGVAFPVFSDFDHGHALFDLSLTLSEQGTDIFRRALTSDVPDAGGQLTRLFGLPVIGLSIQSRANDQVGIGARYSTLARHRYSTCIESGESLDITQPLERPEHCE